MIRNARLGAGQVYWRLVFAVVCWWQRLSGNNCKKDVYLSSVLKFNDYEVVKTCY